MKRSRLILVLGALALSICVVTLLPIPKARARPAPKPVLRFDPKPVRLGTVRPGATSYDESVKVFNEGSAPAPITKLAIAQPFSIVSDSCLGQALASGQSCIVVLNFTPSKKGKYSKPLQISLSGIRALYEVTASGTASLTAPLFSPTPSPTGSATPTPPVPAPTPIAAPTTAGDVLILGGYASLPVIYDPVSAKGYVSGNSFADGVDGGELPENFQSVALPDGTILIAGGDDGSGTFANAYIYKPSVQAVTPTAPMNTARTQFTLTLLNNGKVLAVGGSPKWVNPALEHNSLSAAPLASAEIYDPASQTWTNAASLTVGRLGHAATLLPNGTVLVTGGLTSASLTYALASDYEIFTPPANGQSAGSWTATSTAASPSVARYDHAAVLLDDGSVLLAGGLETVSGGPSTPATFDVRYVAGAWATARENDPRYDDAVVKLANGDVLIAGGIDGSGNLLNTAEVFSATGLNWNESGSTLANADSGPAATLMADGRVLIVGKSLPTMETYDHSTDQFTVGGSLPPGVTFGGAGSSATVIQSAINAMPVGAGPGVADSPAPGYQNIPYASIKVCSSGTIQCRVIDGVVVDTGSVGLRLFASKLQGASFSPINVAGGGLGECFNFIASVTWGPVASADVYMGGEVAKNVPIQIIDDLGSFAPIPADCNPNDLPVLSSPGAAAAGTNGVLGIGGLPNDLDSDVIYYSCANGSCSDVETPSTPVLNPVSNIHYYASGAGSPDYNGSALAMNPVAAQGQAADFGTLIFGIGQEANNTPRAPVQVFQANNPNSGSIYVGYINTAYQGATMAGYLDSGTNGYAFNASNPPISQCPSDTVPNGPWYCPSSTVAESAINLGVSGSPSSPPENFIVGNAQSLVQNGVYADPELAGPIPNIFDWGLPFFYGRTVYLGIYPDSAYINSSSVTGPFFAY